MDSNSTFKVKEVVWGKVKGYPHWPAFISSITDNDNNDPKFQLQFFGDNTTALLKKNCLVKFSEGKTQNLHVKGKKGLSQAVNLAEKWDPSLYDFPIVQDDEIMLDNKPIGTNNGNINGNGTAIIESVPDSLNIITTKTPNKRGRKKKIQQDDVDLNPKENNKNDNNDNSDKVNNIIVNRNNENKTSLKLEERTESEVSEPQQNEIKESTKTIKSNNKKEKENEKEKENNYETPVENKIFLGKKRQITNSISKSKSKSKNKVKKVSQNNKRNKHSLKINKSISSMMNEHDTIESSDDEDEEEEVRDTNNSLLMKITQYLYTILSSFNEFNISEEKQLIIEILENLSMIKLNRPVEFLKVKFIFNILEIWIRNYN